MPAKGSTMPPAQRQTLREINLAKAAERTHKRCPQCQETFPIDVFRPKKNPQPRRLHAYCPPCMRKNARAYHHADPARAARRQRRTDLRIRYGITMEAYDLMLVEQAGRCAICRTTTPGSRKRYFAVDHNQASGAVRALLCIACNAGLGQFSDDPVRMRAAAEYVEAHHARQVVPA